MNCISLSLFIRRNNGNFSSVPTVTITILNLTIVSKIWFSSTFFTSTIRKCSFRFTNKRPESRNWKRNWFTCKRGSTSCTTEWPNSVQHWRQLPVGDLRVPLEIFAPVRLLSAAKRISSSYRQRLSRYREIRARSATTDRTPSETIVAKESSLEISEEAYLMINAQEILRLIEDRLLLLHSNESFHRTVDSRREQFQQYYRLFDNVKEMTELWFETQNKWIFLRSALANLNVQHQSPVNLREIYLKFSETDESFRVRASRSIIADANRGDLNRISKNWPFKIRPSPVWRKWKPTEFISRIGLKPSSVELDVSLLLLIVASSRMNWCISWTSIWMKSTVLASVASTFSPPNISFIWSPAVSILDRIFRSFVNCSTASSRFTIICPNKFCWRTTIKPSPQQRWMSTVNLFPCTSNVRLSSEGG